MVRMSPQGVGLVFALTCGLAIYVSCQLGSAPSGSTPVVVSGQALKGPFLSGATVTLTQIAAPNQTVSTTVTDSAGSFSVRVSWTGPTYLSVSGAFRDEFTGATGSQSSARPLRAVFDASVGPNTVQVNVATSIAAQIIADLQSSNPSHPITASIVANENSNVAQAIIGSSYRGSITSISLNDSSDANGGQVLGFVLAVAAQTGVNNVDAAVRQLARNIADGRRLGAEVSGLTTAITTAQLLTNLQAIQGNQPLTVQLGGGSTTTLSLAAILSNLGTGQTAGQLSAQVQPNNVDSTQTGIFKVGHIVVLMQENRSFDHYFGVLPYVSGSPYHPPATAGGPCDPEDHKCVDGLTCANALNCSNSNSVLSGPSQGTRVTVQHQGGFCTLNPHHGWPDVHYQANGTNPNNSLASLGGSADGFVQDTVVVHSSGTLANAQQVMSYFTANDLPYYYALAQTFAVSDRAFASFLGETQGNRMYLMAGTSFGHMLTGEPPPANGWKPVNGTVFDQLDANSVTWKYYFDAQSPQASLVPNPLPIATLFRPTSPNYVPLTRFATDAAAGNLPQVAFLDLTYLEHPASTSTDTSDVRLAQNQVAGIITALRNSSNWSDSVLFLTYDEHGGFYDHVVPPPAVKPDIYDPGLCGDSVNSTPGQGLSCASSLQEAQEICTASPLQSGNFQPTGSCAAFNQLGFRSPFVVVSPFAKASYVSHVPVDHTSLLKFILKRFAGGASLSARQSSANTLEDLFHFAGSPSAQSSVSASLAQVPSSNQLCGATGSS